MRGESFQGAGLHMPAELLFYGHFIVEGLGREALWDCHNQVLEYRICMVEPDLEVNARIREMAKDQYEELLVHEDASRWPENAGFSG